MKTARWIIAAAVALALVVVGIGYSLPVKHRVSRMAAYAITPDSLFGIMTNASAFPKWRTGITSVENVRSPDSAWSYREHGKRGDVLYVVDVAEQGRRMITRVADKSLPFGGTWTYEITPSIAGVWLRITEDGEVYNPVSRFVSKFITGQNTAIDTYLNDLGRKVGQPVAITD
jgi:hypothetical protein